MIVVDSSVIVAALLADSPFGDWAAQITASHDLVAPALAPFECANIIRRHSAAGLVDGHAAAEAHRILAILDIEYWPYHAVAERCWELRSNLTIYDAAFVSIAEAVGSPLYTFDRRLAAAPGPACQFVTGPLDL